jgi:hypothetical protein
LESILGLLKRLQIWARESIPGLIKRFTNTGSGTYLIFLPDAEGVDGIEGQCLMSGEGDCSDSYQAVLSIYLLGKEGI